MDRAGGGTQRVLDDERPRVFGEQGLRLETVARQMRPRKRHLEIVAEPARKIPLPLDLHALARRAKERHVQRQQLFRPRRLGPINGHRHDQVHALFEEQRTGEGNCSRRNVGPASDGG